MHLSGYTTTAYTEELSRDLQPEILWWKVKHSSPSVKPKKLSILCRNGILRSAKELHWWAFYIKDRNAEVNCSQDGYELHYCTPNQKCYSFLHLSYKQYASRASSPDGKF